MQDSPVSLNQLLTTLFTNKIIVYLNILILRQTYFIHFQREEDKYLQLALSIKQEATSYQFYLILVFRGSANYSI
jgi:hypothetical protein